MKLSISKLSFFLIVVASVIFFKPLAINSLTEYQTINKLWDFSRVLVCALLLFRLVIVKKKISIMLILIVVSQLFFLFSTFCNDGDIRGMIVQMASIIGFCILIEVEIHNNANRFFAALFYGLTILILIHTGFMIFSPEGLGYDLIFYNRIYFLASKNGLTKFFFPAIVSGLVMCELNGGKIKKRVLFIIVLCLLHSIYVQSLTTVVGVLACISVYFLSKIKILGRRINVYKFTLATFMGVLVISIIAFWGGFNQIVAFWVNANKYRNYLARVDIWRKALNLIEESLIIGYGLPVTGGHINIHGRFMYSHNGFLEFLLYGGIVGFILCILPLLRILKWKKKEINSQALDVVLCGIIGFAIMMMAESHISTVAYWGFLVMFEQLCLNELKKGCHC